MKGGGRALSPEARVEVWEDGEEARLNTDLERVTEDKRRPSRWGSHGMWEKMEPGKRGNGRLMMLINSVREADGRQRMF